MNHLRPLFVGYGVFVKRRQEMYRCFRSRDEGGRFRMQIVGGILERQQFETAFNLLYACPRFSNAQPRPPNKAGEWLRK